ncbi:hypothetical protein [Catenulispora rubra]|uniref:hypothetical protein n=1 Tax=Catenulispora rubra TaxID=280293 RepID=UPI001891F9F9|nr:hypothetical protein [Catenulispora rubra]
MPGAVDVLATWEAGTTAGAAERTLLLHALARPRAGVADLKATAVGQRDAELFALRGALFGDRMEVVVGCPDCGEKLEFELGVRALLGDRAHQIPDGPGSSERDGSSELDGSSDPHAPQVLHVDEGSWSVDFHSPTAADLEAVSGIGDADAARKALLARIVIRAERSGRKIDASRIPAPVQQAIASAAAVADPAADVRLAMQCPECSQKISAELDISEYLWRELDVWARAILSDIHLLASCYGWSEDQILALSPQRRRYYVERCVDG